MKWFHSGSDEQSAMELGQSVRSVDQGKGSDYPSLSRKRIGDDPEGEVLSGLSPVVGDRVTGEERLSRSGLGTMLQPVDMTDKIFAELRREEAAAIAVGLEDVFYGYNRWTVQDEGVQSLSHDARWLKDNPKSVLKISGHCDERGSHDYNLILGEKRAKAAKSYLVELGVNPKQVAIVSYGKDRPFCSENDEHCYQQNRRSHMLLKTR
jgi:peptidoglycan-associated lipoprotein